MEKLAVHPLGSDVYTDTAGYGKVSKNEVDGN